MTNSLKNIKLLLHYQDRTIAIAALTITHHSQKIITQKIK